MRDPKDPVWNEYEDVAEFCALVGIKGKHGDQLPDLISTSCMELINEDPESFQERVKDHSYGIAREKWEAEHENMER